MLHGDKDRNGRAGHRLRPIYGCTERAWCVSKLRSRGKCTLCAQSSESYFLIAICLVPTAPVAVLRCRSLFWSRTGVANRRGVAHFDLERCSLCRSDLGAERCLVSAFPVPYAYQAHQHARAHGVGGNHTRRGKVRSELLLHCKENGKGK